MMDAGKLDRLLTLVSGMKMYQPVGIRQFQRQLQEAILLADNLKYGHIEKCSHGVRRDLCPDCAPDVPEYEAILHAVDKAIAVGKPHQHNTDCLMPVDKARTLGVSRRTCGYLEGEPERIEPRNHSHNAACYMLGQRTVSYRTCGKLEGEPS